MGEKPTGLEALGGLGESGLSVSLGPGDVSISGAADISIQGREPEDEEEGRREPPRRWSDPEDDPTRVYPPRR